MTQSETNKPEGQKLTTRHLTEMAFGFRQSGTLMAAIELDLFTKMADGPVEPAEAAEKIGIPVDSAERLMIACAAIRLLEKSGNKYVNAPDVKKYLVRGSPTYYGDWLLYECKDDYDNWKNIASILRPPKRIYEEMASDPEKARAFTLSGYNSSISVGHKLAKEFDFSPYSLFLDVGGGSGCYSIAACSRYPHLRAIVFDQPNVCVVAEEIIAQAGLSDQIKTHAGNFFEDEFPRGVDLVAYITPLQSYNAEEVQFLLNKAFDAVEPGGSILVVDYMLNDDKTGPLEPAFYHLIGLSPMSGGRVNSGAEFCEYLKKAGFVDPEVNDLIPGMLGRVTAKKQK